MEKITNFDSLRTGDKIIEVETVEGLNNTFGGGFVYPLTVTKVTVKRVYVRNDYFGCQYAILKDRSATTNGFYYGKRTEFYRADGSRELTENKLITG